MREKVITIRPDLVSGSNGGRFQGWGSSLCWWGNRIGYSPELDREAARLFYGPEGLGLNIIRYNIGGGDDPSHAHIRRTDSAMPGYWKEGTETAEDGRYRWEYDWSRDADQRKALLACLEACGKEGIAEAFSNSPPYFMTVSGCSSGSEGGGTNNLKEDAYEAFAAYLADVAAHFRDSWNVEFQSITPMNEPDTDFWKALSPKQEGCHFDPGEAQSRILSALDKAMRERGFRDTVLSASDETDLDAQYRSYLALSEEARSLVRRIDTHSYSGTGYDALRRLALREGKDLWMSEVDGGDVCGKDAGEMGAGLYLAEKIISDMNGLLPSAWILWQLIDNHISAEGYNGIPDSGMPDLGRGYWGVAVADHDARKILLTKKYYAFGQFTRYVRPGCTILRGSDHILAAEDRENGRLILVASNPTDEETPLALDLSGFDCEWEKVRAVRTCGPLEGGENWAELPEREMTGKCLRAALAPNSVTTYLIDKAKC